MEQYIDSAETQRKPHRTHLVQQLRYTGLVQAIKHKQKIHATDYHEEE